MTTVCLIGELLAWVDVVPVAVANEYRTRRERSTTTMRACFFAPKAPNDMGSFWLMITGNKA